MMRRHRAMLCSLLRVSYRLVRDRSALVVMCRCVVILLGRKSMRIRRCLMRVITPKIRSSAPRFLHVAVRHVLTGGDVGCGLLVLLGSSGVGQR